MSRAEELANALDMHWIEHSRCHPMDAPMCESAAAELRRLSAVEAELIALKKAIGDAEPVAAQQEAEPWNDKKQAALNDWFLSLSEGRQAALLQDKWTLAGAAFEAGRALAAQHQEPAQQEAEKLDLFRRGYELGLRQIDRPAQQERKPMTDDDVVACIEEAGFKTWTSAFFRLARLVERHHGIKE